MKKNALLMVIVLMAGMCITAFGQVNEDSTPWVYETEYQVPWSRIDSLLKLTTMSNELNFYGKAVEMGFVLDIRMYIHHTGGVWNVKVQWIYSSFEAINEPGWGKKVWEAVGVNEEKIKELDGGFNWVFNDVIHRDNIYRLLLSVD